MQSQILQPHFLAALLARHSHFEIFVHPLHDPVHVELQELSASVSVRHVVRDHLRTPSVVSADDALQPLVSLSSTFFRFLAEEGLETDILLVMVALHVTFHVTALAELFPTNGTPSCHLRRSWWKAFVVDGSQIWRNILAGSGSFALLFQHLVPDDHFQLLGTAVHVSMHYPKTTK